MLRNISDDVGRFVGRTAELDQLEAALGDHRLVTLTGSGGVGKSRLALRFASRRDRGLTGVCWADLWPLQDDELLVATVSDAVGLSDHSRRMPLEALCEWLSAQQVPVLLVLDSCEHMADACRHLAAELLTACPGLTILATSRAPLGVHGEHVLSLNPMPCSTDALELFIGHATAAGADLTSERDQDAAVEICRRLEGMPLALELAAAQLRHHDIDFVAQQLRAHALAGELRVPAMRQPPWHRSLWTTVGWSHELCTPSERLLWARLSVFRGPFGEDTARAVCSDGRLSASQVAPTLRSLAQKSVLTKQGMGYRMLDTLRDYGRMWLTELGEETVVADRHAGHFLDVARRADAAWAGPGQAGAYQRVSYAHDDLRSALDHLIASSPAHAVEMAGLLGFFWACCGHLHEAVSLLNRVQDLPQADRRDLNRARWALGVNLLLQGDHIGARRLAAGCHQAATADRDHEALLRAAYLTGLEHLLSGRPVDAHAAADQALREAGGDPFGTQARVMCRLVRVFANTGAAALNSAWKEAEDLRRECVDNGEFWTRSYTEYQLAVIALLEERPAAAAAYAHAMLSSKKQIGDNFGLALGLDVLAAALAAKGDGQLAALASAASQIRWHSVGHPQRGTPELAPVRDRCERTIRTLIGDAAYVDTYAWARRQEPSRLLARILAGPPNSTGQ
ncbi:regulator [Streptomyces sp. NPDC048491]|uniref:ATP-binding protein n=1 Tax=Streptomyces sp. NPDC048491 TaxID=3157207 RepID=UPI00341702EF